MVAMSVGEKEDALGTIYSGSLIDEKWRGDERAVQGLTGCQLCTSLLRLGRLAVDFLGSKISFGV